MSKPGRGASENGRVGCVGVALGAPCEQNDARCCRFTPRHFRLLLTHSPGPTPPATGRHHRRRAPRRRTRSRHPRWPRARPALARRGGREPRRLAWGRGRRRGRRDGQGSTEVGCFVNGCVGVSFFRSKETLSRPCRPFCKPPASRPHAHTQLRSYIRLLLFSKRNNKTNQSSSLSSRSLLAPPTGGSLSATAAPSSSCPATSYNFRSAEFRSRMSFSTSTGKLARPAGPSGGPLSTAAARARRRAARVLVRASHAR